MSLQILDCDQGSPDWFKARMGIPTASAFQVVLSPRAGKEGVGRKTYLLKLAGELLTGEPMENYQNADMNRGKVMEDEARNMYALMHDVEPQRVGFVRNGPKGASPDSLIDAHGGLEIKTEAPHLLLETLLKDEFPSKHRAQVQGNIWVTERGWWDIAIFWPKLPLFTKRIYRDDKYIADLSRAVDEFNEELAGTVERIRRYGTPEALAA